jgi:hypothetical protein
MSIVIYANFLYRASIRENLFNGGNKMIKLVSFNLCVAASLILTACGGGGGGSGSATGPAASSTTAVAASTPPSFTAWSAVAPNSTTTIQGSSAEGTYTANIATNTITGVGTLTAFAPTTTATFTTNSSGTTTALSFTSANGTSASFNAANGDLFGYLIANPNVRAVVSSNGQNYLLIASATAFGWDYQTFGTWTTGAGTGSGTAGMFSVGALTSGASIPTTGTGTYTGAAGGRYVDSAGVPYFTSANMTAGVDFAARTVAFSTTSTQTSTNLSSFSANSNLNMSGALSYSAGTNQITGTVASVGGGVGNASMTGTVTANFYGPAAQEIGGGYSLRGAANTLLSGSFGGKR